KRFNKPVETPEIIAARVCSLKDLQDTQLTIYADNCQFDGNSIAGKLVVYITDLNSNFEDIKVGSIIQFKPNNLKDTDLFKYDTPNASYFYKNIKYTASTYTSNLAVVGEDVKFAEQIKQYIKTNLSNGLSETNVDLAYSALFGDKDTLSDTKYDAFKASGIAHLLAVSGLHVGIIVAILNFVLKKCKIKDWIRLIIVAVILGFYMYICNFTISVVRASIMSVCLLLAPLVFREYDSLSAIGLAGIVVFLINPLCAFDVGMLLSFSCVSGIILLNRSINGVLSKTKIPSAISSSLSISTSTLVSIMFVMALYFKTLNLISLLANIVLIPLFTIGFVATFVLSIVSLALPFVTYALVPINYLFEFISVCSQFLGNLPFASFTTASVSYISVIPYFVLLLILSNICTARIKDKVIISMLTLAILVCCLV
ncbi:MAG: ComEC/Rec2 family competence protein, partial [Clostridia bacterium]|nr:ComEC/Rec2 family competence protein [Clostridia bacterium]